MDQYETKFAELSKYASKLIEDPIDRARRFRDGLKPEIKDLLVLDYDELYERAQLIERDLNERAVAFGSRFVPNRDNNRFGKRQQAQNQAAATDAVTTATAATAAAPAEVPPRNGNGEWPMYKLVKHFLRLKPPKFIGADDPEAAILWIQQLEKAFALLRCSEEDKVILAVYQLQGNASTWWKATERRVFPEGMVPEWDAFVKVFYRKYFSECAREQKMAEFQCLRQNQMSVDQYEAKFSELSKYAPRLIEDPVDRARRFRDGLKPEIKDPLVPLNLKNYNELYKRAQLIERDLNERAAASGSRFVPNKDNNWFGKRPMGGNYPIPPNRNGGIGKPASNSNVVCQFCGRKHGSTSCLARTRACYGCGQHGHQVKNCLRKPMGVQTPLPQIGQATGGVSQIAHQGILSRPPMQGRVYAITRREAENSQNVVTGS